MASPTFDGNALFSAAWRDMPGQPEVRHTAETLPGVNGRFVQLHGTGGRTINASGLLRATESTPAAAVTTLKAMLRTRQGYADGATMAIYLGTDGNSYGNCILISYRPVGEITISQSGATYTASLRCAAQLLQASP